MGATGIRLEKALWTNIAELRLAEIAAAPHTSGSRSASVLARSRSCAIAAPLAPLTSVRNPRSTVKPALRLSPCGKAGPSAVSAAAARVARADLPGTGRRRPRAGTAPAATPVSFNREILPILANNCFACHGPDEKKRETKFHFDTQEGMFLKKGVIEPGNADESLLVEKITEPNPEGSDAAARIRAQR